MFGDKDEAKSRICCGSGAGGRIWHPESKGARCTSRSPWSPPHAGRHPHSDGAAQKLSWPFQGRSKLPVFFH